MYKICFVLEGLGDEKCAGHVLGVLLAAAVRADEAYLRAHRETPALYVSGVRYHPTPQGAKRPGRAYVQDVLTCLREGFAGNFDLACWRCAELRAREGIKAIPQISTKRTEQGILARATVLLPDGTVLDPSAGGAGILIRPRQRLTFVSSLFERNVDRDLSDATQQIMIDAITDVDTLYLETHPNTPRIYEVEDLTYQEEPPGQEDWQDIATCIRLRKGDCDDFAPCLAAERRTKDGLRASRARHRKTIRKDGGTLYHVVTDTVLPNGKIVEEDPSRMLGMC